MPTKRVRQEAAERVSATGFVIVHRNAGGEVLQAGEPFADENEGSFRAAILLTTINFFPGDTLSSEPEAGQSKEALNQ
jgi:hypothetical protein